MSKRHNILPTRTTFFIQVQEKLKACRISKLNFSSSCFIAVDSHVEIVWVHVVVDSHVEIVWVHVVVFSEHDILHF